MKPLGTKEFASLCAVSPASISAAKKTALKHATVDDGRKIDPGHPDAIRYREYARSRADSRGSGRARKPTGRPAGKSKKPRGPDRVRNDARAPAADDQLRPPQPPPEGTADRYLTSLPEDVHALADYSLRRLCVIFGTDAAFRDWVAAREKLEKIREAELKNAKTEGALVARRMIKDGVIVPVNSMHEQLLSDGSKMITQRVVELERAGVDETEIRRWVADHLGKYIATLKAKLKRNLKAIEEQ